MDGMAGTGPPQHPIPLRRRPASHRDCSSPVSAVLFGLLGLPFRCCTRQLSLGPEGPSHAHPGGALPLARHRHQPQHCHSAALNSISLDAATWMRHKEWNAADPRPARKGLRGQGRIEAEEGWGGRGGWTQAMMSGVE
uniref:Uncharacterized protein n=1 Tax=Eutreptiella gymnastica TaxID=73025 RepID=A0A7S4G9Q5_9EUGL